MAFMLTYDENMCSSFMQTLCPSAKLSIKCKVKGWRLAAVFSPDYVTKSCCVPHYDVL